MKPATKWPRHNPYDKKWFQIQVVRVETEKRRNRIASILTLWEPKLFDVGINVRESLRKELKRLDNLPDGVDWSMFPAWVRKARSK